jgi:hypothetical protein
VKAAAVQQDVAKHPTLSRLSRLRPNPLGLKSAPNRSLAVVPALRPAPVAFPARRFGPLGSVRCRRNDPVRISQRLDTL